jgi:precorrin-2 methylase
MKVSSRIPEVIAALTSEDLLDRAVYVERASSSEQRVVRDLTTLPTDKCSYFSTIVVNKKMRNGILRHGPQTAEQGERV